MIKKGLTYLLLLMAITCAYAQQDAIYDHYMFNKLVINPAFAGSEERLSARLLHRSQWLGYKGAPSTQTFSIDAPIAFKKGARKSMGIGLNIINDQVGPVQNTSILGSYAYRVPIGSGDLAFGVKVGLLRQGVDWNQLEFQSGTQTHLLNNSSIFLADFSFGARYYSNAFFLGLAVDHLTQPKTDYGTTKDGSLYRHYVAITGYKIHMNDKLNLTPSLLFKYVQNSPVYINLNLNAEMYEKFWLGLGYRYFGIIAMLGFNITENLKVGYSYDASISKMSNSLGSTHEIFIGYGFIKSKPKSKESDSLIPPDPVLSVLNQQKDTLTVAFRNEEGIFVFVNLPDNPQYLFLLEGEDSDKLMVYINGKLVKLVKGKDNFFHYKDLPANISKLHLLDSAGNKLKTTVMSENGFFTFKTLPSKSNYTFELESRYLDLVNQVRIAFTDENGKSVSITVDKASDGFFKYEFLQPGSAKLYLLSQNGDTLGFSQLNEEGFFVFSKLSPNESFLFALDADELDMIEQVQVVSYGEAGEKIILTASKERKSFFRYEYLPGNQVKLFLVNKNGDTLQTALLNEDGFFTFKQLPFDSDYLFLLSDDDTKLIDDLLILLIDQNGNEKVITASKESGSLFKYKFLPNKDEGLGELDVADVPIILEPDDEQVIKSAIANLEFNNGTDVIKIGSYRYLGQLSRLMAKNPDWKIELDGHTDNVGTVRSNLALSKKRAEAVKKFLVSQKVDPERIAVKYHGEIHPVASNATAEGRQANRRVEMTITRKASGEHITVKKSDAVIYRVQIYASRAPVYLTPVNFKGIENVEEYEHEGLYKYVIGYSEDYDYAAAVLLYEIKQEGFDQAFIVAFKNGRRITVEEALNSK